MALVFECPRRGIGFSESGANPRPATSALLLAANVCSGRTAARRGRETCESRRIAGAARRVKRGAGWFLRNPIHSHQNRSAPLPLCDLPIANPQIGITSKPLVN